MAWSFYTPEGRLKDKGVASEAWHVVGAAGEPAFQNSWANVAGEPAAKYRKTPDGRVNLVGSVRSGSVATAIFTLPAGYRPPETLLIPVLNWNGSAGVMGILRITAAGSVSIDSPGSNAAVYLSSVSFFTD